MYPSLDSYFVTASPEICLLPEGNQSNTLVSLVSTIARWNITPACIEVRSNGKLHRNRSCAQGLDQVLWVFWHEWVSERGVEWFPLIIFMVHLWEILNLLQEVLAGVTSSRAQNAQTGVYAGCMWAHEYVGMLPELGISDISANASTGNTSPFLVGRVSYTFGLTGPCVITDTACSSSLLAAHLATTGTRQIRSAIQAWMRWAPE